MRKNKLAFKLIDMGLRAETLANLTESQLRLLYNKLNEGKKETKEATTTYSADEEIPAVKVDPKKITKNSDGSVSVEETNESKKKTVKKKYNPFALCTASVGRKDKEKYERCVKGIKESIKEGKDPINLFLEERIVSLLERHIQPKITKGEFLQMIKESETEAPDKQKEKIKTKPTTKPKPGHPGKNPNPGEHSAPKAEKMSRKEFKESETEAPDKQKEKIKTKPTTKPKPGHPGKNPNPGEHSAPKAGRISPEQAKDKIIGVIMNLLKK